LLFHNGDIVKTDPTQKTEMSPLEKSKKKRTLQQQQQDIRNQLKMLLSAKMIARKYATAREQNILE
jgi:hypothetical protein